MAHKLLSYRESTYLVATFKKSCNLVPTLKVRTLVPTLYVTVPTLVVRTRKVSNISSYFLKYVLIKFVYNYGLCSLRHVLIIRIWLDFYEDDMSPWVLASIHIQRLYTSPTLFRLG